MKLYAKARTFTPLFNTETIDKVFGGDDGRTIPLKDGLLKELEMIAFPETNFTLIKHPDKEFIAQAITEEYPAKEILWTDIRFFSLFKDPQEKRVVQLPSCDEIITTMVSFLGAPYLWGGNSPSVPEMLQFYPPDETQGPIDEHTRGLWQLHGMDCSGLLYYSTRGITPRNTSELVNFGRSVKIEGIAIEDWDIQPLDLIVWKGHVIIVIDRDKVIESLGGRGVILTDFKTRIFEIENSLQRKPSNDFCKLSCEEQKNHFVVRRWFIEKT